MYLPRSLYCFRSLPSGHGLPGCRFFSAAAIDLEHSAEVQMRALRDAMRGKGKFEEMGIGGMDDMLNNVFQRAFASRMLPPEAVDKLNLQHTKGMLLHGPPGTGKTLCARQIGYLLGARTPTLINGPEVFSSLVGESEEKIRNIFVYSIITFIFLYFFIFFILAALLSLDGLDFITALSGSASAISNVGPGLGDIIGPSGNFSELPNLSKLSLSFGMLLGRLELFAVLVLFFPSFWKN